MFWHCQFVDKRFFFFFRTIMVKIQLKSDAQLAAIRAALTASAEPFLAAEARRGTRSRARDLNVALTHLAETLHGALAANSAVACEVACRPTIFFFFFFCLLVFPLIIQMEYWSLRTGCLFSQPLLVARYLHRW
jgi:hypothetical protein